MDLLHQGVVEGHISRKRWIEIACATPAKMFGLYPRKGTIAVGSDADLIVIDPGKERTVTPERMHLPIGWNPYTGRVLRGFPDLVLSRGDVVVDGDRCLAKPGRGLYLPGNPGGYAQV